MGVNAPMATVLPARSVYIKYETTKFHHPRPPATITTRPSVPPSAVGQAGCTRLTTQTNHNRPTTAVKRSWEVHYGKVGVVEARVAGFMPAALEGMTWD